MGKSIRSSVTKEVSLFVLSCCTMLMLYLVFSIWLHTRLDTHETGNIAKGGKGNFVGLVGVPLETSWSHPTIHILTSRFMQGQADLVHLTEARLELFEAICLPSIVGQELMDAYLLQLKSRNEQMINKKPIDPPFIWIIKVDPYLDQRSLSKMIQLVKPFPNFFLIGNEIGNKIGRWKNDLTKEKLLKGNVYSGDFTILDRAHHFRNDRVSLETRLDADDGLHKMFLKKVQEQALSSLHFDRQPNNNNNHKADWRAWCAWRSLEWLPEPSNVNQNRKDNTFGFIRRAMNEHMCITPGLTIGISVGTNSFEVPDVQHHHLLGAGLSRKLECGLKDARKCVTLITNPELSAIRARTLTSAGMKGINVNALASRHTRTRRMDKDDYTRSLLDYFNLNKMRLHHTNGYFINATNIIDIASDNLRGQCSQGHSCKKSSREKLQKIINLKGQLW